MTALEQRLQRVATLIMDAANELAQLQDDVFNVLHPEVIEIDFDKLQQVLNDVAAIGYVKGRVDAVLEQEL